MGRFNVNNFYGVPFELDEVRLWAVALTPAQLLSAASSPCDLPSDILLSSQLLSRHGMHPDGRAQGAVTWAAKGGVRWERTGAECVSCNAACGQHGVL